MNLAPTCWWSATTMDLILHSSMQLIFQEIPKSILFQTDRTKISQFPKKLHF